MKATRYIIEAQVDLRNHERIKLEIDENTHTLNIFSNQPNQVCIILVKRIGEIDL